MVRGGMCPMNAALLLLLAVAAPLHHGAQALINVLASGNMLRVNNYLQRDNYSLVMQEDCNLVIYGPGGAVWATGTDGQGYGDCAAVMRDDANFEVQNDFGSTLWRAFDGGYDTGAYYVILQDDGTLSIKEIGTDKEFWTTRNSPPLAPSPSLGPSPAPPPLELSPSGPLPVDGVQYILAGYVLLAGKSLKSGEYTLSLDLDCNLRSRDRRGRVLWQIKTQGSRSGCEVRLQEDGDLQIVDGNGTIAWRSNVSRSLSASYVLYLDGNTGNVMVYEDLQLKTAVWMNPVQDDKRKGQSGGTVGRLLAVIGGLLGGGFVIAAVWFVLAYYGYFDKSEQELQLRLQSNKGRSRALSFSQIRKATKNFERKIGEGGFGPVYYGKLPDGQEVAVKVLSATSSQGKQEFFNEIELLTLVHHKHLVSLVGYCMAWKRKYLVYQYLSGSDLRERLHGESASRTPLSWHERATIILQVAEGLEYLHSGCRIIHRDVKSNNILLTEKVVAKVADFGLSKLVATDDDLATHVTTAVKGTTGYLDPEYYVTHKLTEKSDVYAFGVLVMEIITARELLDKQDQQFIAHRVRKAWKSKELEELVDPLLGGVYDSREFSDLVRLSLWCVKQSMIDRPSMGEVVQELRSIRNQEDDLYPEDVSSAALPYGFDFPPHTTTCHPPLNLGNL